jgi:hypothetical protein
VALGAAVETTGKVAETVMTVIAMVGVARRTTARRSLKLMS